MVRSRHAAHGAVLDDDFQDANLTTVFIVVVLTVAAAMIWYGRASNLSPAFGSTTGTRWWLGSGSLFALCAVLLYGFQSIPQTIEERAADVSLRLIGGTIIASIGCAALFFCLMLFSASLCFPWPALSAQPLPMVTAAATLPHGAAFATILLLATAASLAKSWNGMMIMAVRLLIAMARYGYLPAWLVAPHPRHGSPAAALRLVLLVNIAGVFLGKGAVEPIVDMAAMVLTLTYLLCCVTVLRLRRQSAASPFVVPGGPIPIWFAGVCACVMAASAFLSPFWEQPGTLPLEYRIFIVWSVCGVGAWFVDRKIRVSIGTDA